MNYFFASFGGLVAGSYFVGICIIAPAQEKTTNVKWQIESVAAGHAEFALDPATGETTWQWKKKQEGVKP